MLASFPDIAAPPGAPPNEDCLYLNIWRPAATRGNLPVLVWIDGGGFVNGGSSAAVFSGAELARKGVLVASFNYRRGRFGTFAYPALTKANADHGLLGNYGFLDQVAGLHWLRANVASFGGDSGNITLMGESAGGRSVHWPMTSPLTKGVFRRAIIMSGGDGGGESAPLAAAEAVGLHFAETKGIVADDPQALAKLRALSAEQVTDGLNIVSSIGRASAASPRPIPIAGSLSSRPLLTPAPLIARSP
jgi:para-nitrobenzyl esterase